MIVTYISYLHYLEKDGYGLADYGFILNYHDPEENFLNMGKNCKLNFCSKFGMYMSLPSLFFKILTPVRSSARYLSIWMENLEWSGLYPVDICGFGFLKSVIGISCTLI